MASWMVFRMQYIHKMSIFVQVVARVVHYQLTVGWQNIPKMVTNRRIHLLCHMLISGYFLFNDFSWELQLYTYQICDPIEVSTTNSIQEPPNFRNQPLFWASKHRLYESPTEGRLRHMTMTFLQRCSQSVRTFASRWMLDVSRSSKNGGCCKLISLPVLLSKCLMRTY